jgi:hypothetical protein
MDGSESTRNCPFMGDDASGAAVGVELEAWPQPRVKIENVAKMGRSLLMVPRLLSAE